MKDVTLGVLPLAWLAGLVEAATGRTGTRHNPRQNPTKVTQLTTSKSA